MRSIRKSRNVTKNLIKSERGAINFEYILLCALIALAVAFVLPQFSSMVNAAFGSIGSSLQTNVDKGITN